MLPLPRLLTIARDHDTENALLSKARAYLERGGPREGIHASDLLDVRQAAWRAVTKSPIPDRLINMFVVGQLAHAIVEVIHAGDGTYQTHGMDDGTQFFGDLRYSPDILEYGGGPAEIKTTRSFYEPKVAYLPDDETYHMYLEQLLIYMAAEGKTRGRLIMLYLNAKGEDHRTKPQFFVWTVDANEGSLAAYRALISTVSKSYKQAVESGDPNILPLCRQWKCKDCDFWDKCQPTGRYEYGQSAVKKWTK